MTTDINQNIVQQLNNLPQNSSFSTWVKEFTSTLKYLVATRQEMILTHYLFSLVSYSNQISLKYFALIDYLIKTSPSFIRQIENIIQSIFVKTFVWFYHNKRFGESEQMKAFRFSWMGKINPQIIYNMKLSIYNWIFVDIDIQTNFNNRYKENREKPEVSQKDIFETGKRKIINSSSNYQRFSQGPMKMRHFEQQNSNTTANSQPVVLTEIQQKMKILNDMAPYKCKFCGKRFSQKKNLDTHLKQEIKLKTMPFRDKKRSLNQDSKQGIVSTPCLNDNIWVNTLHIQEQEQPSFFLLKDFKYDNSNCHFCCQSFEISYIKQTQEWAYKDCAKIMIGNCDYAMHKSCYDTIKEKQREKQRIKSQSKMINL